MNIVDRELIQALKWSSAEPASPSEKRRAKRTAIRIRVDVQPFVEDQAGPWLRGEMRDISIHGLCLFAPAPLEPGSQFVIRLPKLKGYERPPVLVCRTARCSARGSGQFLIGAQFTNRLDPQSSCDEPAESVAARIRQAMLS
jgi:hypothetical protein